MLKENSRKVCVLTVVVDNHIHKDPVAVVLAVQAVAFVRQVADILDNPELVGIDPAVWVGSPVDDSHVEDTDLEHLVEDCTADHRVVVDMLVEQVIGSQLVLGLTMY